MLGRGAAEAAKGGAGAGKDCAAFCAQPAGPGGGARFSQCKQQCQACGGPANVLFNCTTNTTECASATCAPSVICPGSCAGTCCGPEASPV